MRKALHYVSDLHLTDSNYKETIKKVTSLIEKDTENNLCIVGDIGEIYKDGDKNKKYKELAVAISYNYEKSFLVPGNHEYNFKSIEETDIILDKTVEKLPNVHFLKRNSYTLGNYKILGCTLWTPNKNKTQYDADKEWLERELSPLKFVETPKEPLEEKSKEHEFKEKFVEQSIQKTNKKIVLTHYPPSYELMEDKYKPFKDQHKRFYNSLDGLIQRCEDLVCWISGHTHSVLEKNIGNTKCCVNAYNPQKFSSKKIYLD